MMNTPFVMVYRVSPLTYLLGKPRVKVPRFAMVNLIAEEEVVPELVQDDFTAQNVVDHITRILPDGSPREHMLEGLARVKARLRAPARLWSRAAPRRSSCGDHPCDPIKRRGSNNQTVFPSSALSRGRFEPDKVESDKFLTPFTLNLVLPASFASESSS